MRHVLTAATAWTMQRAMAVLYHPLSLGDLHTEKTFRTRNREPLAKPS